METLKAIRDLSFVLAIYMYFCGWVYIYYYLNHFGISIANAGIDFYSFITYFYSVASFYIDGLLNIVVVAIVLALLLWGYFKFLKPYTQKNNANLLNILAFIAMVISIPLAFYLSQRAGISNAKSKTDYEKSDLKYIKFSFTDTIAKSRNDSTNLDDNAFQTTYLRQLNETHQLRLVLIGNDEYFVLYINGNEKNSSPLIYHIPKDKILFAQVITF